MTLPQAAARWAFLRSAVESVLRDEFRAPFAATLGVLARDAGRRIVCSHRFWRLDDNGPFALSVIADSRSARSVPRAATLV